MAAPGPDDDPTISDDAELWRRVPPDFYIHDERLGHRRPSSGAFDNHRDGSPMSAVLAAESRGVEAVLAGHEGYGLVAITAGLARACGQGVVRAPLPDEPAHAHVVGPKTNSVKKRLAREARSIVEPST
jgi:hypothetical protein